MLRVSSDETNSDIDLTAVAHGRPAKLVGGTELEALTRELTTVTDRPPTATRDALVEAQGKEAAE